MFVIDAAVHISQRRNRTEDALRRLQQADVDSAIVFADAASDDLEAENRYILRSGKEFEAHPFYYLGGNPYTDTRMDLEVPHNLDEYAGVRWHRWFGSGPDRTGVVDRHELEFAVMTMETAEFEGLMSGISYYRMPIIFEEDFGVTAEFVARYAHLKIIIPHMGILSGGTENIVGRFHGNENISFTTGLGAIDPVSLRRIGAERLLFASDYPHSGVAEAIARVRRLELGDEDEAMVLGENAERLLGGIDDSDEVEMLLPGE